MTPAKKNKSAFRWIIALIFFLAYLIAGADRANIGVVVPFIKNEYHLSNTDIGALASLFYITYAIIQIPAGYCFSRFGIQKLLTGSLILTSLATLFIGMTHSVLQLKFARGLLGAAEGPINIGIISVINRWFPAKEKGLATGIFMSAAKVAPAIVPPLCAMIIALYGWREVFYIFAVPGLIIAALWIWLVKDNPEDSIHTSQEERDYINADEQDAVSNSNGNSTTKAADNTLLDKLIRTKSIQALDNNRSILLSWNNWACALGYFLMVGITYAIMTWIPTYLINVKHFTIIKMGFVASAPWIGAIIGNILGGILSDRVFKKRRKPVMLITTFATIGMMYTMLHAPENPTLLALLFLVTGILLNLGYSTFLVYPMGLASKNKVPFAASIVNTGGSLGGAFAPFVVGWILDHYDWNSVFIFLAGCSLLALILLMTMIEPRKTSH